MTVIMLCVFHGLFYDPESACPECSKEHVPPLPRIAHSEAELQGEQAAKTDQSVPTGQDGQLLENFE